MIHLDSSFLIDLLRETVAERPGAAFDLIESLDPDELLGVSVHVACELRAGAELSRHALREHEAHRPIALGPGRGRTRISASRRRTPACWRRALRGGRPVASMDLLIATAATLDDAPLVTRNVKDFSRVPGLRVLRY